MRNTPLVTKVNTINKLLEVLSCQRHRDTAVSFEALKQLSTSDQLHDDVQLGIRGEDFLHANNVLVFQTAHDVNLAAHLRRELLGANLFLVHYLDCDARVGLAMDSNLNPARRVEWHTAHTMGLETRFPETDVRLGDDSLASTLKKRKRIATYLPKAPSPIVSYSVYLPTWLLAKESSGGPSGTPGGGCAAGATAASYWPSMVSAMAESTCQRAQRAVGGYGCCSPNFEFDAASAGGLAN